MNVNILIIIIILIIYLNKSIFKSVMEEYQTWKRKITKGHTSSLNFEDYDLICFLLCLSLADVPFYSTLRGNWTAKHCLCCNMKLICFSTVVSQNLAFPFNIQRIMLISGRRFFWFFSEMAFWITIETQWAEVGKLSLIVVLARLFQILTTSRNENRYWQLPLLFIMVEL